MSRLCLYYRPLPEVDRWVAGDRFVRPILRRLLRGRPRMGGVDKVFHNLCLGLDRLGYHYEVNLPFHQLRPDDYVGVLGRGRLCLEGYQAPNPIVAGIGLMTHPSEWPTLCQEFPVHVYLQHSEWANNLYVPYYGKDRCKIWPVGIDTEFWNSDIYISKTVDVLLYNKVMWRKEERERSFVTPIRQHLTELGFTVEEIRYGSYSPAQYFSALLRSRAMIFLCEHESQGLAYQEALSTGVPILAWDQGWCLDPNRFAWGKPHIPATSVPYWDERCGMKFKDLEDFQHTFPQFWEQVKQRNFRPREYILENLTLEQCAVDYTELLKA